jgi:hypothetical protein
MLSSADFGFLFVLHFDSEDGGSMFARNIGLSSKCVPLQDIVYI